MQRLPGVAERPRTPAETLTLPGRLAARRDLLGDAVDVAAAEEDLAGGDADDLAVGEGGGEDRGRLLVARRIEQRVDDPRVADVEVDVAGGEAVAGAARLGALDRRSTPAASAAVVVSGPGAGTLITSKRCPRASVAASSRASASREIACWGSSGSSTQVSRTTPGRAKQARLSTWPSVSSSKTPSPSQTTFSVPR